MTCPIGLFDELIAAVVARIPARVCCYCIARYKRVAAIALPQQIRGTRLCPVNSATNEIFAAI